MSGLAEYLDRKADALVELNAQPIADEVEKSCPILNLLRSPQSLRRALRHAGTALRTAAE